MFPPRGVISRPDAGKNLAVRPILFTTKNRGLDDRDTTNRYASASEVRPSTNRRANSPDVEEQ
jgi:hypothetical protein